MCDTKQKTTHSRGGRWASGLPRLVRVLARGSALSLLGALLAACDPTTTFPVPAVSCPPDVPVATCDTGSPSYSLSDAASFFASRSIPEILQPGLGDYRATLDAFGRPVILIDPLAPVTPAVATFFLAHEYGHHFLGHTARFSFEPGRRPPPAFVQCLEYEADCFAVRALSQLDPDAARAGIEYFARGGCSRDQEHASGPARAAHMRSCLDEALTATATDALAP